MITIIIYYVTLFFICTTFVTKYVVFILFRQLLITHFLLIVKKYQITKFALKLEYVPRISN
jgi:hypothetical protein